MRRNPWKTAALGVGVLLVLALIAGGIVLWGRDKPAADPTGPSVLQSTHAATPGAPLPQGPVVAGEGGVPEGPGGLHIKYPRTPDGAAAAATNYYTAFNGERIRTDKPYQQQLAKTFASTPELEKEYLALFADMEPAGEDPERALRPERGAYAIESASKDTVKVVLWVPWCTTANTDCSWDLVAIVATWAHGDWKLTSPHIANDRVASAPVPVDPTAVPTPTEKGKLLGTDPSATIPGTTLSEAWKLAWMEYANAAR